MKVNKSKPIQESLPLPKDLERMEKDKTRKRIETVRKSGITAGKVDAYYYTEKGVRPTYIFPKNTNLSQDPFFRKFADDD